ncbi:ZIP family metal transporter [Candidatus Nomurabacteria bacterium]|nr:ZIP family metal transporter [Candidatus Nomurabacteria bacterium]
MFLEAVGISILIALLSVLGVVAFGHDKKLIGAERYVVPVAAGVFLSLVLNELLPETLEASPEWGGTVVVVGFLAFYILSHKLHERFHHLETEDCNRKGAASLLLIGDGIHNFTDGIILGGAFLIDPTVGVATAIGLAMHEIPQEIVEFGVLIRAGYTRLQAAILNLISASTIVLGTVVVLFLYNSADEYVWILVGLAAGNMLYLAAGDLIPRIHDNLKHYGSIWRSTISIAVGFILMTLLLTWVHENFAPTHEHDHSHEEESHLILD